jgi:large subunit ribosomal protein L6
MTVVAVERRRIKVPDGVTVTVAPDGKVTCKGPNATLSRVLRHPQVQIKVESGVVVVEADLVRRKVAALVGTFGGHIRNMCEGARRDFNANMKVVYSHFPIKAKVQGDRVIIENFLGEKAARRARIMGTCKIDIKGNDVVVKGPDIEDVGQTAVNIEIATRIRGFDNRVFQDGIYIVEKPR